MSGPAVVDLLAGIARDLNDVPAAPERAARHRDLVAGMNAAVKAEADRRLTLDSDPRGLEALFAAAREAGR